jgi:ERCC4-related helicase
LFLSLTLAKCKLIRFSLHHVVVQVFVMTPAILLQNLHHCFMRMDCIELLIFDECHHADKRHPYACIMQVAI